MIDINCSVFQVGVVGAVPTFCSSAENSTFHAGFSLPSFSAAFICEVPSRPSYFFALDGLFHTVDNELIVVKDGLQE